jgi:glycosyltransferase involved in cell wall biosynthesis
MSEHQPLFTVATVSYNSGKWVRETIESVLASSFTDLEYLISDDRSTDDTWAIIREYNDPRIRSWQNEKNIGEYPNRNKVLKEAKGKYIIYVDGDDVLYEDTLRKIREYVDRFPEAVSVWGVRSHQLTNCIFPVLLQPKETMKWIYAANLPISVIGFAETVFKVQTLRQAGGLSEQFISGDTYIKKRIAMEGPVLLVPLGFMFWRRSDNQASLKLNKGFTGYINNVLIDREILSNSFFNDLPNERALFLSNSKLRDIKVLFGHTFLKGKIFLGIKLWSKMKFRFADLRYLFRKADFSYRDKLSSLLFHEREINGQHGQ